MKSVPHQKGRPEVKMAMIKLVQCPTYVYTRHCRTTLPSCTTRNQDSCASSCSTQKSRRVFSLSALTLSFSALIFSNGPSSNAQVPQFIELPNSGGVKALDLRIGDGDIPLDGDVVGTLLSLFFPNATISLCFIVQSHLIGNQKNRIFGKF